MTAQPHDDFQTREPSPMESRSEAMPDNFMTQLFAKCVAGPPTPADRRMIANAAMDTAISCVQAGDYAAATAFIEDALAQVRVLRGMTEGGE